LSKEHQRKGGIWSRVWQRGKRVDECVQTRLWSRTDWDAHTWCAELIRNRVSRNRFRSDGLARVCGPSRYYVGKLIILSIMPDLCPGRALRVRWCARPKSYSLVPNSPGIIDGFPFFFLCRCCRNRCDFMADWLRTSILIHLYSRLNCLL